MLNFDPVNLCLPVILPFLLSFVVARVVIAYNILDVPNHRSSHAVPVPRCGGIAIVAATMMSSGCFYLMNRIPSLSLQAMTIAGCALLYAAVGLIDDLVSLRPSIRFMTQVCGAVIAVFVGQVSLIELDLSWISIDHFDLSVAGTVIAVVWIIGYTNYFNFMDGLNGMVGGNTIICSIFIALLAYNAGQPWLAQLTMLLASATGGFLVYNFPHGRLFLGDVGSYYIGFLLSIMPLLAQQNLSIYLFIILYFNFLFDATFTLGRRLIMGQNILSAHRGHLYQLLQQSGRSHMTVSLLYWSMSLCQGIVALQVQHSVDQQINAIVILIMIAIVFSVRVIHAARRKGIVLS